MKRSALRIGLFVAVDVALLAACLLQVPHLLNRPRPPFDLTDVNGHVLVRTILDPAACPGVQEGDTLVAWNGQLLTSDHDVEFLTDFLSVGDTVHAAVKRAGSLTPTGVQLLHAYDLFYLFVILMVGIVAWGVGVFVLVRRPTEPPVVVLHWALVAMGVTVMITWGRTPYDSTWMYLSRTLFLVGYAAVAATFLHFTMLFPRKVRASAPVATNLLYLPLALVAAGMIYFQTKALQLRSLEAFNSFQILFDIFHVIVILYVAAGLIQFIRSYYRSTASEERKKLQWILWGLAVGPLPFLILTIIPQYYMAVGFVAEEFTLPFLVLIPIAFGISFIKYHILDIELVVNRTTVYGIVLGAVILVYSLVVGVVATIVGTYTFGTSAVAAVIVALLFEPVRKKVQHFVDKQFFRVRYDFRNALHRFSDDIKMCVEEKQLADLLIARTQEIIPVERIGVALLRQPGMRLYFLSQRGFDILERRSIRLEREGLKTELLLPVAVDAKVEPGIRYEPADERVFHRWGMALVFPMKSATDEFIGFFVLGAKKSDERFSLEDVDLLETAATQAGIEFERIALQRKVIEQQAEKSRLEEINRHKSEIVSNVSHELRTPLTSIKMYAEMLGTGKRPSDRRVREYLRTIVGEADRLDRLVSNILDSSRIERGAKQYQMEELDLKEIVRRVLKSLKYQLNKHGFHVTHKEPTRPLLIFADADAVARAITNVIDNAIKFSPQKKSLTIVLSRRSGRVTCTVRDQGSGISPDALEHLFERFYRDPASSEHVQGVGLGLSLVKHIMVGHDGDVQVQSEEGKGSAFTLWFPVSRMK